MEVLLFALFFIASLLFFISGTDDFGRKEINVALDQKEEVKKEGGSEQIKEVKKEVELEST